jgi:hypothetical protein
MKIDSGIKIPKPHSLRPRYPWLEMKVDDSFVFPPILWPHETARAASRRHHPKRFVARKTADGVRCWRVQ